MHELPHTYTLNAPNFSRLHNLAQIKFKHFQSSGSGGYNHFNILQVLVQNYLAVQKMWAQIFSVHYLLILLNLVPIKIRSVEVLYTGLCLRGHY